MLLEGLHPSRSIEDFAEISRNFLDGYARLVRNGLQPESVGLAMIGATVNLYALFEMSKDLPDLLREVAEQLEEEPKMQ